MKLILKICDASVLLITAIGPLSTTMLRAATMDPRSVKKPEMTSALLAGKQLYDAKCAECHGVNTVGTNKGRRSCTASTIRGITATAHSSTRLGAG